MIQVPLTTREVGNSAKNSPLTNAEVDQNFLNLQNAIQTDVVRELAVSNEELRKLKVKIFLGM